MREVRKGDPFDAGVDCEECPDEGGEDEEDVNRRQKIILQAKLKRGEGEVENQVEREWKRYEPRQFSGECFVKYRAVCDRDNDIQHRPHRSEEPRGWSPRGFEKCGVPVVNRHALIIA